MKPTAQEIAAITVEDVITIGQRSYLITKEEEPFIYIKSINFLGEVQDDELAVFEIKMLRNTPEKFQGTHAMAIDEITTMEIIKQRASALN